MKAKQLREQTVEELQQSLRETRKQLLEQRALKSAGGAGEQPLRERTLRRDVARIMTVLNEREQNADASNG